jgi:hypothetical protein
VEIEELLRQIQLGVMSRERVSSVTGRGGALEMFRATAEMDRVELEALRTDLAAVAKVTLLASYGQVEAKAVIAQEIRTRVNLLSERYRAAFAEDERSREHIRADQAEHVRHLLNRASPGG